jgi:hypothetical protein
MIGDGDIAIAFLVFFSMLIIGFYLFNVGLMTANIALVMSFGTIGFFIFWFWGIDRIYIWRIMREGKRRYGNKK